MFWLMYYVSIQLSQRKNLSRFVILFKKIKWAVRAHEESPTTNRIVQFQPHPGNLSLSQKMVFLLMSFRRTRAKNIYLWLLLPMCIDKFGHHSHFFLKAHEESPTTDRTECSCIPHPWNFPFALIFALDKIWWWHKDLSLTNHQILNITRLE